MTDPFEFGHPICEVFFRWFLFGVVVLRIRPWRLDDGTEFAQMPLSRIAFLVQEGGFGLDVLRGSS